MTSCAGLELFGGYLQQIGFNARVRDVFVRIRLGGDFGPVAMVRVVMALLVVGGRRLRHAAFLHDDPWVRRFSGLRVVPTARTLSRWLQRFTMRTGARVQALNAAVVTQMLTTLNLATLTLDVDGTVVSTGLQVERAFRGFRKKVHHRSPKNYQPDLFDPNDGHYEYSAVTSNLDLPALWQFMCGRGGHGKTIGELEHGLAFGSVPTASYAANSAWQQLVALTHNLLVNFQLATGATARPRTRKRTVLHTRHRIQTLRFVLFQRAGLLLRPAGTMRLRLADNPATRALYTRIGAALARAA